MKVLILTDWNRFQGGAEAIITPIQEGLKQQGHEVRLLTADVSDVARDVADETFYASENIVARAVFQVVNPFAISRLRKILKEFQPEVVLVNMFALFVSPGALLALGRVPYVIMVSDFKCICPLGHRLLPDNSVCSDKPGLACYRNDCLSLPHYVREIPRYALIRKAYEKAAMIISISEHLQATLARYQIDSVSLPLFSPLPTEEFRRDRADQPTFLYLGRLDIEKGVDTLIKATAIVRKKHPEVQLRIVGRGPLKAGLEQLSEQLGQSGAIRFTGWKSPEEVDKELSTAWAMVAPSRWPEPFGLVTLEAMQRGVPVIATTGGGFQEQILEEQSGLLFAAEDVTALARKMNRVVTGDAFASGTLDPSVTEEIRQKHDQQTYFQILSNYLSEAAQKAALQ